MCNLINSVNNSMTRAVRTDQDTYLSLLNYVPYMLSCATCLVPYVLSCPKCLLPHVPRALRAFVLSCPTCLTCLVSLMLSCLTCLLPYVTRAKRAVVSLTCRRCSCSPRVLCLACFRAGSNSTCSFAPRPSLASGVSSACISCLLAFSVSCAFVALAISIFNSLG